MFTLGTDFHPADQEFDLTGDVDGQPDGRQVGTRRFEADLLETWKFDLFVVYFFGFCLEKQLYFDY